MFVVVTIFACGLAWLVRTANVVRERNKLIQHTSSYSLDDPEWPQPISWKIVAFLFGYKQGAVYWDGITVGEEMSDKELERMHHVFPEAKISRSPFGPNALPRPEYRQHPPGWW